MKKTYLFVLIASIFMVSCADDDAETPSVEAPATYSFERDGQSTVSFSGQTARISMAQELTTALSATSGATEEELLEMFRNETAAGEDADPFTDASLNESTKNIKSKTAASKDFFSTNTVESLEIKEYFENIIHKQVTEVAANQNIEAAPGTAGQIADGNSTRYVSAKGLEYNQVFAKGLIGALMTDQALNNYLGTAVLDEADNRVNNDNDVLEEGKAYTTMEHKWDEAYGYLYGTSANPAAPNLTIGEDDSFLNKYIGRVEGDEDFEGIAEDIFNAFALGRAAIVAGDYDLRDEQVEIIREKVSQVIAIRAVHYLQQGKNAIANEEYGSAFHDLSEGYGFVYSLRFTRVPGTNQPYFTKEEVDGFLTAILGDGDHGLWDVETSTLDEISEDIAAKFTFTVDQAGS